MRLKKYWFYFRWFLIGKNHCIIGKRAKKCFNIVHKILWLLIIITSSLGSALLTQFLIKILKAF
ncbi:hypothetical protein FMM58_03655 [Campylobacter sp. LR291e]|nr:hypothetical protein FMM54_07935 [Campylobacter sp. LR185c]KAA6226505.1 hypothetical protein FMM57_05700 [Campylobacter sp. LR286c]KAA6230402.1 hypothetical protein FMM56_06175 [Campylobacter sp. LR264d]KAA6231220.1 hypothetical protein FMM58_03655 [Campylobacter sp. LR291e]KAA8603882.1 hypothetical protein CGP82_05680 [Campylobacter sp. LR185c]